MGDWRLLDYDPTTNEREWFKYDAATDTTLIRYEGDAQNLLDVCREDNNHADKRAEFKNPLVHVATVSPSIQMEWLVKYGIEMWNPDHKKAVNRLLDGPYKHLKRLPIMIGNH